MWPHSPCTTARGCYDNPSVHSWPRRRPPLRTTITHNFEPREIIINHLCLSPLPSSPNRDRSPRARRRPASDWPGARSRGLLPSTQSEHSERALGSALQRTAHFDSLEVMDTGARYRYRTRHGREPACRARPRLADGSLCASAAAAPERDRHMFWATTKQPSGTGKKETTTASPRARPSWAAPLPRRVEEAGSRRKLRRRRCRLRLLRRRLRLERERVQPRGELVRERGVYHPVPLHRVLETECGGGQGRTHATRARGGDDDSNSSVRQRRRQRAGEGVGEGIGG